MKCKIRVTKTILDLFPECRPEEGAVYDAEFMLGKGKSNDVAIIEFGGKKILLRKDEFEIWDSV